jgi:hypothetical protein
VLPAARLCKASAPALPGTPCPMAARIRGAQGRTHPCRQAQQAQVSEM